MSASLILTANDQCYAAWKHANVNCTYFTRVDISEYYLYARINGEWVYKAN